MASEEEETVYCLCRLPYDETRFMIECDVCKDWFHGSCVGVQEYQASDIETYHCPNCQTIHGPLVLKKRRNWHRHDYSETNVAKKAVQTGTVVFIRELKNRTFSSAEEIPMVRLHGTELTQDYFEEHGFNKPILIEKKDGLGLSVPPSNFSIQDVENHVGSMREIDVIDVARQEDYKMLMREWTEYYNSPNRDKIFNVISLEFSKTKLTDLVETPSVVREISWANVVWPSQLPEDCPYSRPDVQKYCLMGVKDSFTDFHIDFGGTSVWYHVLRGEKSFYLIEPTTANLALYERWLSSSGQSETFFGDQADKCYKCVVKQGQTLFIPTGWIHAVFTNIDSLVFGGNFLHSYNIPLQLQVYEIERSVQTPEKYLFPCYETMNWYAAKYIADILKDCEEDKKKPKTMFVEGAKAIVYYLKLWTQRKDFIKNAKHEVPENIQYGRLLKELAKVLKNFESQLKGSPKKPDKSEKKRKKKSGPSQNELQQLDLLHQMTKEKLMEEDKKLTESKHKFPRDLSAELKLEETKLTLSNIRTIEPKPIIKTSESQNSIEERKKIYNFDEEDDLPPPMLKVRIPKAGAYCDPAKEEAADSKSLKLKVSNGKIISGNPSPGVKAKLEPLNTNVSEPLSKTEKDEDSDPDQLVVDETPKRRNRASPVKPLKIKLNIKNTPDPSVKKTHKTERKQSVDSVLSEKTNVRSPDAIISEPASRTSVKSENVSLVSELEKRTNSGKPSDALLSELAKRTKHKTESEKQSETLLSELEKLTSRSESAKSSETVLSNSPPDQRWVRSIPLIRGGLNGSIADILEASGYGTETEFKVDQDSECSGSPNMRDAIQGMLSMSRMGGMQLFSKDGQRLGSNFDESEEVKLERCYKDEEYVYPSLELSDDEEQKILKPKGKSERDDNWNPKARVNVTTPKADRPHRDGAKKISVESGLKQAAANLADRPKIKRPIVQKHKPKPDKRSFTSLSYDVQPGTSSGFSSNSIAIKRPAGSTSPPKSKKPKKGQATAKQRLGAAYRCVVATAKPVFIRSLKLSNVKPG